MSDKRQKRKLKRKLKKRAEKRNQPYHTQSIDIKKFSDLLQTYGDMFKCFGVDTKSHSGYKAGGFVGMQWLEDENGEIDLTVGTMGDKYNAGQTIAAFMENYPSIGYLAMCKFCQTIPPDMRKQARTILDMCLRGSDSIERDDAEELIARIKILETKMEADLSREKNHIYNLVVDGDEFRAIPPEDKSGGHKQTVHRAKEEVAGSIAHVEKLLKEANKIGLESEEVFDAFGVAAEGLTQLADAIRRYEDRHRKEIVDGLLNGDPEIVDKFKEAAVKGAKELAKAVVDERKEQNRKLNKPDMPKELRESLGHFMEVINEVRDADKEDGTARSLGFHRATVIAEMILGLSNSTFAVPVPKSLIVGLFKRLKRDIKQISEHMTEGEYQIVYPTEEQLNHDHTDDLQKLANGYRQEREHDKMLNDIEANAPVGNA